MRFSAVISVLLGLSATTALAQRNGGFGSGQGQRGGGGRFPGGGFNPQGQGSTPTTFLTQTASAAGSAFTPAVDPQSTVPTSGSGQDQPPANTPPASNGGGSGNVDASLIPPFGITAGVKLNDGTANCAGVNNKGIPCTCPPDLGTFTASLESNVAAGAAFPTSNSVQDQLTRLNTCIVTLQNFIGGPGSGVGCPAVSTNWVQLRTTLQGQL